MFFFNFNYKLFFWLFGALRDLLFLLLLLPKKVLGATHELAFALFAALLLAAVVGAPGSTWVDLGRPGTTLGSTWVDPRVSL